VGSQLAYATDRTGTSEIWLKSLQDNWERPLVTEKDFGRAWISSFSDLAFSMDGQRLAFAVTRAGGHSIYLFNSAGGPPIKLTTGQEEEVSPTWSPDGNWVAYATNTKGAWWVAKTSSGGNSAPSLVLQFPSLHRIRWSPAGHFIACSTRESLSLISTDDNKAKLVSKSEWLAFDWMKDGSAIVGIERLADGSRVLASLDIQTGIAKVLGPLDLPSTAEVERLSLAPDAHRLAVAISKPRGDIWLLEGFPGSQKYLHQLWASIFATHTAPALSGL
jgi:dipeptidyl aminopeptidase/acylaminoacyl peptidase